MVMSYPDGSPVIGTICCHPHTSWTARAIAPSTATLRRSLNLVFRSHSLLPATCLLPPAAVASSPYGLECTSLMMAPRHHGSLQSCKVPFASGTGDASCGAGVGVTAPCTSVGVSPGTVSVAAPGVQVAVRSAPLCDGACDGHRYWAQSRMQITIVYARGTGR